jgi:co-chaperonin GroES (HSP10)
MDPPVWGGSMCHSLLGARPGHRAEGGSAVAPVPVTGDGRWDEDGEKRIPLDVSAGDTVLYSKYGGTEIKVDGEDLLVLRESDVLAKIDD